LKDSSRTPNAVPTHDATIAAPHTASDVNREVLSKDDNMLCCCTHWQ